MAYSSRSGRGRYDGGGYPRRDASLRRSTGGSSSFGAIGLRPVGDGGSGRPTLSPWASGQGPSRHSWGGSGVGGGGGGGLAGSLSQHDLGGRGGPDVFSQLGRASGGGQSDTLNMATQLVSALLENQRQRAPPLQPPPPFAGPAGPGPLGPGPGFGPRGGAAGFRGGRSSFDGGRTEYGHRPDFNAKFDRREAFASPGRGRAAFRGRGATARSRPYPRAGVTTPSTGRASGRQTGDKSGARRKDQPKKGVKTTQEAIDEAKAAALEKQMEANDDKSKGAEGADLMSKEEGTKADNKATETKDAEEAKKADTSAAAAKDGKTAETPKKTKPAKPPREKIASEYLNCTVCNVLNVRSEQTFSEHTRGRRHQQMMELLEQRLEQTAKLIRIEVQVAAKRAEQEAQRRTTGKAPPKEAGYCGMCNVKVYKDIQEHRFNDPLHSKLKKFLHPRCCSMGFDTPVMYEKHLLSFTHFRKSQQRDKERAAAGKEVMAVIGDPAAGTAAAAAAKQNGDAPGPGAEGDSAAPAADGVVSDTTAAGGATEGNDPATAATEGAAEAIDGSVPAADGQQDGEKPVEAASADGKETSQALEKEKEGEQEEEEEEVPPVMYDPAVPVGVRRGSPFMGTFCTLCRIVTPDAHWQEHCCSRMHYDRLLVARAAAERARKEAAEKAAAAAAKEAKEAKAAEAKVAEDQPESKEAAAGAANGEARGTKRPAEEEDGGETKKPATDASTAGQSSLDTTMDDAEMQTDSAAPAKDGQETLKAENGETAAESAELPAQAAEKTADQAEKPAEGADVKPEEAEKPAEQAEKPAEGAEVNTEEAEKPAAAPAPASAPAPAPAPPPAVTSSQKAASRGRGGRGGGCRGGGSPGRGGFARRRSRGRGGRF